MDISPGTCANFYSLLKDGGASANFDPVWKRLNAATSFRRLFSLAYSHARLASGIRIMPYSASEFSLPSSIDIIWAFFYINFRAALPFFCGPGARLCLDGNAGAVSDDFLMSGTVDDPGW